MTGSLATPQPTSAPLRRAWHSGPFSRFFAFTPLWILVYAHFASRSLSTPMYSGEAGPLWIPPAVILDGLVLFWMAIGVYVLWGARSRVTAAVVYLAFTIPATIALVFGPAIVLILQNAT